MSTAGQHLSRSQTAQEETSTVTTSSDWTGEALCSTVDPELWFPESGGAAEARTARALCGTCPVQRPCLQQAMALEGRIPAMYRFGIWGGLSGRQRHALALTTEHDEGHEHAQHAEAG
ncbi:WhiB family transcriptional regulator [Kineococcus terrestris]|uniref:WhiB family transcriptional regulator n=1 Tax=Kineococcus terrestris TaxID=2044856 RepID=UPI0034DB5E7A